MSVIASRVDCCDRQMNKGNPWRERAQGFPLCEKFTHNAMISSPARARFRLKKKTAVNYTAVNFCLREECRMNSVPVASARPDKAQVTGIPQFFAR